MFGRKSVAFKNSDNRSSGITSAARDAEQRHNRSRRSDPWLQADKYNSLVEDDH